MVDIFSVLCWIWWFSFGEWRLGLVWLGFWWYRRCSWLWCWWNIGCKFIILVFVGWRWFLCIFFFLVDWFRVFRLVLVRLVVLGCCLWWLFFVVFIWVCVCRVDLLWCVCCVGSIRVWRKRLWCLCWVWLVWSCWVWVLVRCWLWFVWLCWL